MLVLKLLIFIGPIYRNYLTRIIVIGSQATGRWYCTCILDKLRDSVLQQVLLSAFVRYAGLQEIIGKPVRWISHGSVIPVLPPQR